MVSSEQAKAIDAIVYQCLLDRRAPPSPRGISEAGEKATERIGTALINGSWFMRHLGRLSDRAVVMHGHRHIDWIGECGGLVIASAPSPVMGGTDDCDTYFCIHTPTRDLGRKLRLLTPERVDLPDRHSA
jgi:hypothetical protein